MNLLRLCFEFMKTGLFSVGGGLATLPFIYEIGVRTGWFTAQDVSNMVAVSESTPGPMGVNMATYIGHSVCGITGGILATISLVLPSVIIIMIIARILEKFRESNTVKSVMYGIRPASVALIVYAMILVADLAFLSRDLFASTGNIADLFNFKAIILGVLIFVTYIKWKKHPIWYIVCAGVIGVVFKF